MKLIHPSIEIITEFYGPKLLQDIERIGRICYKSEDKITPDSSINFVKSIIANGHESVIEHFSISVKITCDRAIANELVRHRIASFSQESTRYCNYNKTQIIYIIPPWVDIKEGEYYTDYVDGINDPKWIWFNNCLTCEENYNKLIKLYNWKAEQARSVLPHSLKTEIIITANLREWRHILKLRTSKKAHPQMREIMNLILDYFKKKYSIIFDDIGVNNG